MQMDYLADGSVDCPLLRIFDFTSLEVTTLIVGIEGLADGSVPEILLESAHSADAIALVFRLGKRNDGITQVSALRFECTGTKERYLDMVGLLEPFVELTNLGTHQWLNEDSDISLLITTSESGSW
jgi:hypothetical protein